MGNHFRIYIELKAEWIVCRMSERQEKILKLLLKGMLFAVVFYAAALAADSGSEMKVISEAAEAKKLPVVVIDAGHGGTDPGKVGINGVLEKDINLQIANILKMFLEANDIEVIMTRETDDGLCDSDAENKKVQDMKRRIALIEESSPVVAVSIHQNSYPEEYVSGAQVFYYTDSTEGKRLAEKIQIQLIEDLVPEKERQIKANDSYYLLKKTAKPIVIVECGFLSNSREADKLSTSLYQEKVAWAIHLGVLQYINEKK